MLKRVAVYNALANLKELPKEKYYDYFTFIEPNFKKTFFTMLNNADVPVSSINIIDRLEYFLHETPKILEALEEAGIHEHLGIMTLDLDLEESPVPEYDRLSITDFVTRLMALYLVNYEKDGRFADLGFQYQFFGYIKNLYTNKNLMFQVPDEYKYIFIFLVRKLLWFYTTIDPNRDQLYLDGTVDDLLNFVLEYGDWYNTYTDVATAMRGDINKEEVQLEVYETETETEE